MRYMLLMYADESKVPQTSEAPYLQQRLNELLKDDSCTKQTIRLNQLELSAPN